MVCRCKTGCHPNGQLSHVIQFGKIPEQLFRGGIIGESRLGFVTKAAEVLFATADFYFGLPSTTALVEIDTFEA